MFAFKAGLYISALYGGWVLGVGNSSIVAASDVQINAGIWPFCPTGKEFCRVGYYVMLGVKVNKKNQKNIKKN